MYVIVSYDVGAKRVKKALAICRKYLIHVHKSVFEGNLSEAKLGRLKRELMKIIDTSCDSIRIYRIAAPRFVTTDCIGITGEPNEII